MNLYQRWKRDKYYMLSRLPCQEGKFKEEFPGFGVHKSTQSFFFFFFFFCACGLTSPVPPVPLENFIKGYKTDENPVTWAKGNILNTEHT